MMALSGRCLCGAVSYESSAEPVFIGHCYCIDCQKETGGGHVTIAAVPTAALTVSGTLKAFSKPGDSGQMVERSFCPTCGSTLFGRPQLMSGTTMLRAGTLDDPAQIKPMMSVYVSSAQHWDAPSASIPGFPKMPPRRA